MSPQKFQKYFKKSSIFSQRELSEHTYVYSRKHSFKYNSSARHGAVVVTRDNFRDHVNKKPEWEAVIRDRILMPTFVGDDIQWPEDPLERNGPCLGKFLRF